MSLKPSTYIVGAWIGTFVSLIPCVALAPQDFRENLGISDYGIEPLTVVPYSLGLLASVCLLGLATRALHRKSILQQRAHLGLRAVAILQLALLLVPDFNTAAFHHAHVSVGVTLFVTEGILGLCFSVWGQLKALDSTVLVLLILAGISSFLSLINRIGWLGPSEIAFQLSFLTLCVAGIRRIE